MSEAQGTAAGPSHGDARVWWRIGWLSFGGPAGQIALMQRELVEQRRWIELPQFLAALNFCMLLPGPEAQQLATYIGWHRRGWRGALVAGGLFVLPGMAVMLALSIAYVRYGRVPWVDGLMFGVRCAVAAIVLEALWRIGRRALVFRGALTVAVAAFVALFAFAVPYPAVVAIAALAGWILGRRDPPLAHIDDDAPHRAPTPAPVLLAVACAWLAPLALLWLARGADDRVVRIGALNTELAVVTFGGAYAALAYVSERAVAAEGWLGARQMADGLGLAETTPGPLILVLQFVAFVAAYGAGGAAPLASGIAASLLAAWCLFVPSLLWILLGAPHLARLNANAGLRRALAFVTAAVVGVIAQFSLWFAMHVLFGSTQAMQWGWLRWRMPEFASVDPLAVALSLLAALLLFGLRRGLAATLAVTGFLGLLLRLA